MCGFYYKIFCPCTTNLSTNPHTPFSKHAHTPRFYQQIRTRIACFHFCCIFVASHAHLCNKKGCFWPFYQQICNKMAMSTNPHIFVIFKVNKNNDVHIWCLLHMLVPYTTYTVFCHFLVAQLVLFSFLHIPLSCLGFFL